MNVKKFHRTAGSSSSASGAAGATQWRNPAGVASWTVPPAIVRAGCCWLQPVRLADVSAASSPRHLAQCFRGPPDNK